MTFDIAMNCCDHTLENISTQQHPDVECATRIQHSQTLPPKVAAGSSSLPNTTITMPRHTVGAYTCQHHHQFITNTKTGNHSKKITKAVRPPTSTSALKSQKEVKGALPPHSTVLRVERESVEVEPFSSPPITTYSRFAIIQHWKKFKFFLIFGRQQQQQKLHENEELRECNKYHDDNSTVEKPTPSTIDTETDTSHSSTTSSSNAHGKSSKNKKVKHMNFIAQSQHDDVEKGQQQQQQQQQPSKKNEEREMQFFKNKCQKLSTCCQHSNNNRSDDWLIKQYNVFLIVIVIFAIIVGVLGVIILLLSSNISTMKRQ